MLAIILFLIEFSTVPGILSCPTEGLGDIDGYSRVFFPLDDNFFIENTADLVPD